MKNIFRLLSIIFLSVCMANQSMAQELKTGDMISGAFDSPMSNNAKNLFVAEVTEVNGTEFSCRFVHSNSKYVFKNYKSTPEMKTADVKSTDKGVFKQGTSFMFWVYTPTQDCGAVLKVTFKDGKSYLADSFSSGDNYELKFTHSGSKYIVSKDQVILSSGGTYKKGETVKWECLEKIN